MYNWHANYSYTPYGAPTALVVPPTAQLQTDWSWGAPSMRVSRIDHQFTRNYPGPAPFGAGFRATPNWPQDTAQFGVYYVRGPWWPTQPARATTASTFPRWRAGSSPTTVARSEGKASPAGPGRCPSC